LSAVDPAVRMLFHATESPVTIAILVAVFDLSNQTSPVDTSDAVGVDTPPKILPPRLPIW